jgi:hypothetical protein
MRFLVMLAWVSGQHVVEKKKAASIERRSEAMLKFDFEKFCFLI